MGRIDSKHVLLTCGDGPPPRRLPFHGSRRPDVVAALPSFAVPARPGRDDLAPVLAADPTRIVVAGTDADLAAVLLRLLRSDRLAVEVAFRPVGRSAVATLWGTGDVPVDAPARATPLVRDDTGGVLAGRADVRGLHGECYCDDALVLRGAAPRLVVAVGAAGLAVRAGRGGRLPDGRARAVAGTAASGRGAATGRAVQVGGLPFVPVADGVPYPRPLERRTWYRHTADWLLVRPGP